MATSNGAAASVIGLMILAAGGILTIVGIATPVWGVIKDRSMKATIGLWMFCYQSSCSDVTRGAPENYKAIWGFLFTGLFFTVVSGVLALVNVVKSVTRKEPAKGALMYSQVFGFLALASIEVGVAIWGSMAGLTRDTRLGSEYLKFGYSFYMCAVGGILVGFGGFVGFISSWKAGKYEAYVQEAAPLPEKTPPPIYYN